ncbi:MAG: hypothetical protein IPL55_07235 [Saprospiraceae bacterium]|jgi:hypothetical protein|nr:hypothetical protein [Saprospiraceae bacterium]
MTETELLNLVSSKITLEMKALFDREYFDDECISNVNLIWYNTRYAEIMRKWPDEENPELFVEDLKIRGFIPDVNNINEDELFKIVGLAIFNLYRYEALVRHGNFDCYEDKLKFVLSEDQKYFNYFRTDVIPNYGEFTVFPQNDNEIEIYIKFLNENLKPDGHYRRLYDSYQKSFEILRTELMEKLTDENHSYVLENEIEKLPIYAQCQDVKYQSQSLVSVAFYRHLYGSNLDLFSVLKGTKEPIIFYIILFFRRKSEPYGKFLDYLYNIDWNTIKNSTLMVSLDQINLNKEYGPLGKNLWCDLNGKYIVKYYFYEELSALKSILSKPIWRSDFKLIMQSLHGLQNELIHFSHINDKVIAEMADRYIKIGSMLKSDGIKDIFLTTLISYFSTEKLHQVDVRIWAVFKSLILSETSISSTTQVNNKLKTNLSVPQLAQLFKLIHELKPQIFNVASDAELHRFISMNFETKKSNESGISTEKLRQLFHTPEPNAAEFWEKHLYTMIHNTKKNK